MDITVIGLGYVGLSNAVVAASYLYNVIAYDVDKEKVALLKQGVATIEEPNIQELLTESRSRIRFLSNPKDAIRPSRIIVIAVDTPENKDGSPNLKHVYEVLDNIARFAIQDTYIVMRSTVPVGTCRLVKAYLEERNEHHFDVISMPEFLRQGSAIHDIISPSRLIFGADSDAARMLIKSFAAPFAQRKIPVMITSLENAEMIKYASNNFLAMKISYINNIARLCDVVGADVEKVALGISLDPRIGSSCLKPGIGYGGSCLPKDTQGLYWLSGNTSEPLELVKATIKVNETQADYFLNKIFSRVKSVNNMNIAVLGVGFKGGTEDVRNSPATPIIKALLEKNANIKIYDPLAMDNYQKAMSRHTHITYYLYAHEALKGARMCLILNDSEEFKKLTSDDFIKNMKRPLVFDGRNIFKLDALPGVEYHSVGRKTVGKLEK